MLRVVTLPITYGIERSFLTLFTPFVAEMVSKEVGGELTVMLNTVGIKSNQLAVKPKDQLLEYRKVLSRLGMGSTCCKHDGDDSYEVTFQECVSKMIDDSTLFDMNKEISWCSCGRVEVPTKVVHDIVLNQREKSLIEGTTFLTARCRMCHSFFKSEYEQVKVLRFPKIKPSVIPVLYRREIESVAERTSQTEIVVTRRHRGVGEMFDVDFRWYGYIAYLANPGDDVIIVTSPTTLNQAIRVMAFSELMFPQVKIRLLVHPLIRLIDDQTHVSKMSINDFFDFIETPLQARMFLALGIQWGAIESKLHTKEVQLVRNSSRYFVRVDRPDEFSLDGARFGRIDVCNFYKQLRRQCGISKRYTLLAHCIQPSS